MKKTPGQVSLDGGRRMCYTEFKNKYRGERYSVFPFGKAQKSSAPPFDKTGKVPVIRASICTGEQTAGFKDEATGKFTDVMLIRGPEDLRTFMEEYGVRESEIRKEW